MKNIFINSLQTQPPSDSINTKDSHKQSTRGGALLIIKNAKIESTAQQPLAERLVFFL
jgi:hypothetical protein